MHLWFIRFWCVQIHYEGMWEGVGHWKLRAFWALWNGIEPIGECHFSLYCEGENRGYRFGPKFSRPVPLSQKVPTNLLVVCTVLYWSVDHFLYTLYNHGLYSTYLLILPSTDVLINYFLASVDRTLLLPLILHSSDLLIMSLLTCFIVCFSYSYNTSHNLLIIHFTGWWYPVVTVDLGLQWLNCWSYPLLTCF